jgi:hypothetical protein
MDYTIGADGFVFAGAKHREMALSIADWIVRFTSYDQLHVFHDGICIAEVTRRMRGRSATSSIVEY